MFGMIAFGMLVGVSIVALDLAAQIGTLVQVACGANFSTFFAAFFATCDETASVAELLARHISLLQANTAEVRTLVETTVGACFRGFVTALFVALGETTVGAKSRGFGHFRTTRGVRRRRIRFLASTTTDHKCDATQQTQPCKILHHPILPCRVFVRIDKLSESSPPVKRIDSRRHPGPGAPQL